MTTIAVTGASGFLGRHILAALTKMDADVVAHARRGRPELPAAARRRWVSFDLGEAPGNLFESLGTPDILIHLAWEGLPNYLSARHVDVELPGQIRFLRALTGAGLRRLVVAGTCFEYGMQSGCLHEEMPALPSTQYGRAKDTLRRELEALAAAAPLDLRWLRLFYLYGNGQAPTSLYAQFRAAVARGAASFDMSPGDQLRDFMRIEDAASAVVALALAPRAPRVVNVCSGRPTSVRDLVQQWRAEMNAAIELKLGALGYPSYEPFAFWGDDRLLRETIGRAAG